MALSTFTGNFSANTSTGNQSITNVGFLPKVIFFLPTALTANGIDTDARINYGVGVSSTERFAIDNGADDNEGTATDTARESKTDKCIMVNNAGTSTAEFEADLVSQDADGFTINITTAPGTAYRVGFICLAGDDLTNVKASNFAMNTSTGNQAVTGVGFQPDALMFFGISKTITDASENDAIGFMGMAVSSSKQSVLAFAGDNGVPTSNTSSYQRTNKCIAVPNFSSGSGVLYESTFVSMDSDGFTTNITTAPASADIVFYLALKGGKYDVGSFLSQDTTGNFSKTGVGFQPTGIIFGSTINTVSSSVRGDYETSFGLASSSTERWSSGASSEDGQSTSDADSYQDDTKMYLNYNLAQSKQGDADFVSNDSDGFTLNQTDADPSNGREIIYLAVGSDAAPVTGSSSIGAFNYWNKRRRPYRSN